LLLERKEILRNEVNLPVYLPSEQCPISGLMVFIFPSDMAIRKMVASLNDPFTRFLEPEKLKSLRIGPASFIFSLND